MSARGRAGGIVKVLLDGEGSFITQGTNVDGGLEPKSFTSKIVSNKGTSEITMVFDGRVRNKLAASTPLPRLDRVPVTETNRQGVVDPLTAMLFSASGCNSASCQKTRAYIHRQFSTARQRYDLKLAFKRMAKTAAEKVRRPGGGVLPPLRTDCRPQRVQHSCQIRFRRSRNGACARTDCRHALASTNSVSIAMIIANLAVEAIRFEINIRTEAPFADPKAP